MALQQIDPQTISPTFFQEEQLKQIKELVTWTEDDQNSLQSALRAISEYRPTTFDNDTFKRAQDLWLPLVAKIPLGFIEVNHSFLVRARLAEEKLFSTQGEISYPKTTGLGRFSFPNAPVFYGSLPHENSQSFVVTAMMETCKDMTDDACNTSCFDFCVGRWNLKRPFFVLNLCHDPAHLIQNTWIKGGLQQQLADIKPIVSTENHQIIADFWKLISFFATVKDPSQTNYFLSSAFFTTVKSYYENVREIKVNGVMYPSSMTEMIGLNVALVPDAVDEFLELANVILFRARRGKSSKHYDVFPYCKPAIVVDGKFDLQPSAEMLNTGLST